MALTVQNLRAVGPGVEPASLLPGQIAFNVTDKVLFVGDGSSVKTAFDGTQTPGVPGEGWYAMPMDFASLGDYYVANPGIYGDVPTDQQVLTWSTSLNHPIWTSGGGGGGGNQVYVVTNTQVASASGATTSDKITAAIGVASPDEGDVTIVTGLPDDVYEGLYFFTTEWVKGAAYAYPSASEVIYDNAAHPTLTATVQGAIDDLDDGLIATTAIANTANSTANSALSIASAALPKAGGTMTGTIVARSIDVQSGYNLQFLGTGYIAFNAGANGTITGITDAVSSTSSTLAGSANSVRLTYDLANAALARSGGTMTGTITFAVGQTFPISGIDIASASQLGVVQIGANIQVAAGVISVDNSTTSTKGVVQLDDTLNSTSLTLALTARAGKDLQDQIDALTLASNVTLAGSLNATTGLLDSATTLGIAAGFNAGSPLPAAAPGNADYYVLVTVGGSYNPPGGGGPYAAENGDWFLSDGASWQYLGVGARPQSASYTTAGIVQLADTAVTYTGTSDTEAVTPNSLQDKLSDSTSLTDSNRIASSTAVKSAYDLANAALPLSGGTMTGDITFSGAGVGIVFNDASTVEAISDSTSTTSSVTAASSTAVKSAYDLANSALQRAGGTMTGAITFAAGQTFPISGIQDATTGQKGVVQVGTNIQVSSGTISVNTATTGQQGVVQVGTNIDVSSGTISVKSASTTQAGIVQLNNTVASTSTTQALTANQGYQLQQQINALSTSNNVTFAGTFDAATSVMVTVTVEGAAVGFVVGSGLPIASAAVAEYFVIVSTAGTTTPPGGSPTAANVGDWFLASASSWTYIAAGYLPPYASTTTPGIVELATNAETQTGADATKAVTPASLQSKVSDSTSTTSSIAIASSTAVKSAYDLANAAVPKSCYTALGALVAGTGSGTIGTLPVGTNFQFLAVNTACSSGLEWINLPQLCGYTCTATPFNTALGAGAGDSVTSGVGNTTLGYCAGTAISTGSSNTVIGNCAGDAMTGGANNTAIGVNALGSNLNGNSNVAVGSTALGNAICDQNTAIGNGAGCTVTIGTQNVLVGFLAGATFTSACGNTVVGWNAMPVGTVGSTTAIGSQAFQALTTGTLNTAVGFQAGLSLVSNGNNAFFGTCAGRGQTSGNNTAVGTCALAGGGVNNNTGIGYLAGAALTTGGSNTFVGAAAGDNATTADNAVAIGYNALGAAHTVNGTVAVGANALASNTSGAGNTAVGFNAGTAITTGSNNTILGFNAADNITTGTQNTFLGACTGGAVAITSEGNTAVGFSALGQGITSGAYNVAVGTNAGLGVTSGALNTLVGFSAGSAITTGGSNTLVGRYAGTAALANNVVLSDGAGTIRFQSNSTGAISLGAGGSYGTAGQILVSSGSGAAPTWTTSANVPANYGSFLRTTTQTNTGGATGQAAIFDTTVASNNFSVVGGTQITAAVAGTYTIVATYQVAKTDTGTDDINVWFKKNGTNVPNSAFNLTLVGNNAAQLATTPWIITLAAGDQIEAWWWSADANAILLGEPAAAPYPAIPAVNLVIMPVGA